MQSVLASLRLRQFRNFEELELNFPRAGVAIIGENGSGKSNLLESIYYLEIFRSFRGAADEQLVRFGAPAFHVRGHIELGERSEEIGVGYEVRTRRKRVLVDGNEPERMTGVIGKLGVVIFSPSDVQIVTGAPGERRRFLDIVLSVNVPGYLSALQRYRQLLRNRNAVLRSGRVDQALLGVWEEPLVEQGARITVERAQWVAAHAASFANKYAAIGGGVRGCVHYQCGIRGDLDLADELKVRESFRADLHRLATRERERGQTLSGPHRDDIGFVFDSAGNEIDLREFGSGGQVRTAAIALRMIEAETIHAARSRDCVVLLDDVFAELDVPRSRRIMELLEAEERGQVILTAPKESDIQLRGGRLETWRIAAGKVFR
ncbi:MAG TPA: DNA replication and repair protein RecF [Longimicrobiales bacterium]|nr:DNA replication and repair protein RecF [Longimicrobiales bacterium]